MTAAMTRLQSGRARFLAVLVVAAVLAGVLVAASRLGSSDTPSSNAAPERSVAAAEPSLFSGIPQDGAALGSPQAPVTLVEYADLQCPYCAQWSRDALPTIVAKYVRTGKVRVVFNGMAFVGPDSVTALRTAIAAGRDGRLWNVIHGLYAVQGAENSNWVSDGLLMEIAANAGLDGAKLLETRSDGWVGKVLERDAAAAEKAGIHSTPSFQIGATGGPLARVQVDSLGPEGIVPAIESALAG